MAAGLVEFSVVTQHKATKKVRLQSRSCISDEVFWRKDGTRFPVEYTSTPVLDDAGRPRGVVCRDIASESTRAGVQPPYKEP
jgi:hypothetical protein